MIFNPEDVFSDDAVLLVGVTSLCDGQIDLFLLGVLALRVNSHT